jgi:hypothetical protein
MKRRTNPARHAWELAGKRPLPKDHITPEMRVMDRQELSDVLWARADQQGERPLSTQEQTLLDSRPDRVEERTVMGGYPA